MAKQNSIDELKKTISLLNKETVFLYSDNKKLTRSRLELLQEIEDAKIIRQQLENKIEELTNLSNTDGLTELFNHRFMMERCQEEFNRSKRYSTPLSVLMLDLDHFKQINDSCGHQFGDTILKTIANIIRKLTRNVDICGRYGGEEFVMLATLPLHEAMEYAMRLNKIIENQIFSDGNNQVRVTVSIGVADYRNELNTYQELVDRADQALYQAKKDGRNIIRSWSEKNDNTGGSIDYCSIDELKGKVLDLYKQVKGNYIESTNALLGAIDAKDHYTLKHSRNVAKYAVKLANHLKLPKQEIEVIKNAALFHDIGKIGIDKNILTKKNHLSAEEFENIKKHPAIGVNILKNISFLAKEIPIIRHHHERYDGKGYPHGLRENEIPLGAKIIAVADAYDAMTTEREFQTKISADAAFEILQSEKGQQFDPKIVESFIELIRQSLPKAAKKIPGQEVLDIKTLTSSTYRFF